jgi:hypothetical protein
MPLTNLPLYLFASFFQTCCSLFNNADTWLGMEKEEAVAYLKGYPEIVSKDWRSSYLDGSNR